MKVLFAIDDDPARYEHLQRLLGAHARVVVGCCPLCVETHLDAAAAVLLDHDLDGAEACACGRPTHWENTRPYLLGLMRLGRPVVVTSASSRSNIRHLVDHLRHGGVRHVALSAIETDPELRWIGWLWAEGVL